MNYYPYNGTYSSPTIQFFVLIVTCNHLAPTVAAAIIPLHRPRHKTGLLPSVSIISRAQGNNIEIITSLRRRIMITISTTIAIITPVLLPKATGGAALLPASSHRHCHRPTPTTNNHDHDDDNDAASPLLPASRSSCHHDKSPYPSYMAEGAAGRHPEEASSSLCRSRGEVVCGGPGMRCRQRTGGSDNESEPHLSRHEKNRPNLSRPLPHGMTESRPMPAPLPSLSSSSPP